MAKQFDTIHIPEQSKLRDYQLAAIDAIKNAGPGSHVIVLPTGAGKTVTFSHIPRQGRVLILSHRDELVHQPEKYYINETVTDENGNKLPKCTYGVEQASAHSNGEEVVSASVQSLVRRLDQFEPDDFDMIITDECHHSIAPTYRKIYDYFKPRVHLGFTATPDRADGADLRHIYDDIIFKRDMKWGIKTAKCITDIEAYQVNVHYDLRKVKKQMGDFVVNSLSRAMMEPGCVDEVVKAYNQMRKGQTLIFAVNVEHAHAIASKISGAAVVIGETKNRQEIFDKFANREIPCIVNVMVATEGTDLPLIETIIMARPTTNQSLYCQMIGRGLRLYPGKEACRLIDCVGVTGKIKPVNVGDLFGLNMNELPETKKSKLNGKLLTEYEDAIEQILDAPEFWISANRVQIFEEDNGLDLHDINFVPLANKTLKLSLAKFDIYVPMADELGETQIFYCNKNAKTPMGYMKRANIQDAIDALYDLLQNSYKDDEQLWNHRKIARGWGKYPASDKQKSYIASLMQITGNKLEGIQVQNLTKAEAGIVIERLTEEKNKLQIQQSYYNPSVAGSENYQNVINRTTNYGQKKAKKIETTAGSGWY